MKPEIVEERPITCFEAKSMITSLEKRDEELSFRSGKTKDYLNQITHLDEKQAGELHTELTGLDIPRLKDVHIVKIVDIFPQNEEDVKNVLSGYGLILKAEQTKQISEVLAKFR